MLPHGALILANVLMNSFESSNFYYRNLSPDHDDFEEYLSWMRNGENGFVESIRSDFTKDELLEFVVDRQRNIHIANVKFEPINIELNYAWMGILLGRPSMRGKGFSKEIIDSSCGALTEVYAIQNIYLGVDSSNLPALNAYRKCSFQEIGLHEKGGIIMLRKGLNPR